MRWGWCPEGACVSLGLIPRMVWRLAVAAPVVQPSAGPLWWLGSARRHKGHPHDIADDSKGTLATLNDPRGTFGTLAAGPPAKSPPHRGMPRTRLAEQRHPPARSDQERAHRTARTRKSPWGSRHNTTKRLQDMSDVVKGRRPVRTRTPTRSRGPPAMPVYRLAPTISGCCGDLWITRPVVDRSVALC